MKARKECLHEAGGSVDERFNETGPMKARKGKPGTVRPHTPDELQ